VHYLGPDGSVPPPVGLWRWDVDADTVVWSTDLIDLLGGPSLGPPASYAPFLASVPDEDRPHVDRTLRPPLATGERCAVSFRCPAPPSRGHWFPASARRTVAADGTTGVAGIVRFLNAPDGLVRRVVIGSG